MIKLIIDYFGGDREEESFDSIQKASAFNDFLTDSKTGVVVDSVLNF